MNKQQVKVNMDRLNEVIQQYVKQATPTMEHFRILKLKSNLVFLKQWQKSSTPFTEEQKEQIAKLIAEYEALITTEGK